MVVWYIGAPGLGKGNPYGVVAATVRRGLHPMKPADFQARFYWAFPLLAALCPNSVHGFVADDGCDDRGQFIDHCPEAHAEL